MVIFQEDAFGNHTLASVDQNSISVYLAQKPLNVDVDVGSPWCPGAPQGFLAPPEAPRGSQGFPRGP